ncbi:hypothetical protein [Streptomyces europaeiscabiei]|uniref:hypothetical protein n=1 Tax=Streptomyces europaeiscabiei TaxID=146819 RepID=UPI0029BBEFD5|nr:hypothetical protein [Streptomyces europaeiscabiei]MDX2525239.1 hypothetical protein [Streptomyces europaeiscabiei]
MFQLPDGAPWGAALFVAALGLVLCGWIAFVRAVWPQNSRDRKELLQERQRERARRRLPPGNNKQGEPEG